METIWAAPRLLAMVFAIVYCAQGQEIHLKTRTITITATGQNAGAQPAARQRPGSRQNVHQIVAFDHPPGVDDLNALLLAGAQVTGALPDNAVMVSTRGGLAARPARAIWVGSFEAQDKVSPVLANALAPETPVIVEFHSDVNLAQQAALGVSLGITFFRPAGLLPQHVIVEGTAAEIADLSRQDEVAYIFPADSALLSGTGTYPCAGMLTAAGAVAQYAGITHGWNLDPDQVAHLSYYFGSVTAKVPAATVESEIVRALNEWSAHANVTFTRSAIASVERGVYIQFASGSHGDTYPFDGPGGMLAHTFYPVPANAETIAGDMHFDADEAWRAGGDIDLYTVALHEAGHALGLTHSDNPGDVMYSYYHRGMVLSANDIAAARQLYAPATPATSTPVTTIPVKSTPEMPVTLTLDTVPSATQAAVIDVTGIVTGGSGPYTVQWQTNRGYTGTAAISADSDMWTACGVPLVTGTNIITVTAFDAANRVSTKTATVAMQQAGVSASSPIAVRITSPASAVITANAATISVAGTASGGAGITQVTWQTSNGATGVASGVSPWLATGIPLPEGTTTIVLRAWDAKGATAWVAVVAVRL